MQSALEAEVEAFLGRARYQRRADAPDARAGSSNGYCPTTVKTTAGRVPVARPKLRGNGEVVVGLDAACNEGNDACDEFLDGLKARGLRPPLLVISDGAAGLVGAIDRTMARSLRQRCLVHRSRKELMRCFRYLCSLMWYGDH